MQFGILDFETPTRSTNHFSQLWLLDSTVTFLNHGSFGACPRPVLELQRHLREQMEREPVRFFMREFEPLLDDARRQLAAFIGADWSQLTFVSNATTGINAVLRSLPFEPGDEVLTTNHEYNACRNALDFVAHRLGVRVVVAEIPLPIEDSSHIIEAVMRQVSSRTRLALLDHVTSQTGLIFPIQQLARKLAERGVDTLIDGAHAPGMVPLNLQELGATYYTGNCHKWLCAPKGAAFLYVRQDKQAAIRPLTISHGANSPRSDRSRFQLEFDWMGTDDPTPYLCVPEAIRFMGSLLPGGWSELMAKNRSMALAARQMLANSLAASLPCPEAMIGSLAVIPLPDALETHDFMFLHDQLLDRFGIEVPIIPWQEKPKLLVRISAQLYNTLPQYEYLAKALIQLLE